MLNDKKIKELEDKIIDIDYSNSLPVKSSTKPDVTALTKLAHKIRKTVEDYSIETTTQPVSSNRP